jgi:anti-anti-sigma factor
MSLEITHTQVAPGTAIVTLAGKVMMGPESEQIVSLVDKLLREGTTVIVFDLSGVARIDSTGIGRFIFSHNKIAAAGGTMRMAGATGHLFQVFHVSLLDRVFRFYPTVAEARDA